MAANNLDEKSPFKGKVTLTNKALSYGGTTILLANISNIERGKLIRRNGVNTLTLAISLIVFLIFLSRMYWGLIFVIPSGWLVAKGIWERWRPNLYGITLHLNSGARYNLYNKDRDGIERLYTLINEAIHKDAVVNTTMIFQSDGIIFNTGDINTGDNYQVKDSQVGAVGRNASA